MFTFKRIKNAICSVINIFLQATFQQKRTILFCRKYKNSNFIRINAGFRLVIQFTLKYKCLIWGEESAHFFRETNKK